MFIKIKTMKKSLFEKINFLSNHINNITKCGETSDILCSFIGNNWSDDFIIEHKFLEWNPSHFYIGGGKLQKFVINSFEEIFVVVKEEESGSLKSLETNLNVKNLIEYL